MEEICERIEAPRHDRGFVYKLALLPRVAIEDWQGIKDATITISTVQHNVVTPITWPNHRGCQDKWLRKLSNAPYSDRRVVISWVTWTGMLEHHKLPRYGKIADRQYLIGK